MKNNVKIIIAIFAVLAIGALILYFTSRSTSPIPEANPIVKTDSTVGCYVAHLGPDVYTLIIEKDTAGTVSGKVAFNNFEKDSSSGSFEGTFKDGILLGNYSFESEGSRSDRQLIFKKVGNDFVEGFGPAKVVEGKEVFMDTTVITYDSKLTFVKSADCTENFTDKNNTFTFDYNSFFKAYEGQSALTTEWRQNAKNKGVLLASVSTYKSFMPNTNFSDVRLTVGRSTDPKELKACMTNGGNGEVTGSNKNIDGYNFTKFSSNGAGAGNFYETVSYRGLFDGDCYAIEYTIHSTNLANYPKAQNIKEFDKAKIESEFEKIVESFHFLLSSS